MIEFAGLMVYKTSTIYGSYLPSVLVGMFTESLYQHSWVTTVLEAIANAGDENLVSGKNLKDVLVQTNKSGKVSISDKGRGLTEAGVRKYFLELGNSSKAQDDTVVGAFGAGGKAAVGQGFSLITKTREEGEVVYDLSLDYCTEDGKSMCRIMAKRTELRSALDEGEATGTTLEIQVPLDKLYEVELNVLMLQARQSLIPENAEKECIRISFDRIGSCAVEFAKTNYSLKLQEFAKTEEERLLLEGVTVRLMGCTPTSSHGIQVRGGTLSAGGVISLYSKTPAGVNGGFAFNMAPIAGTRADALSDILGSNNLIFIPQETWGLTQIKLIASREGMIDDEHLKAYLTLLNRTANAALAHTIQQLTDEFSFDKRIELYGLLDTEGGKNSNLATGMVRSSYEFLRRYEFTVEPSNLFMPIPAGMSESITLAQPNRAGDYSFMRLSEKKVSACGDSHALRGYDGDSSLLYMEQVKISAPIRISLVKTNNVRGAKIGVNAVFLVNDEPKERQGRSKILAWLSKQAKGNKDPVYLAVRASSPETGKAMGELLNKPFNGTVPVVYASALEADEHVIARPPTEEFGSVEMLAKPSYTYGSLRSSQQTEHSLRLGVKVFITKDQARASMLNGDSFHLLAGIRPCFALLTPKQINFLTKKKAAMVKRGIWEADSETLNTAELEERTWVQSWVSYADHLKAYLNSEEIAAVVIGDVSLEHNTCDMGDAVEWALLKVFNAQSEESVAKLKANAAIAVLSARIVYAASSYERKLARAPEELISRLDCLLKASGVLVLDDTETRLLADVKYLKEAANRGNLWDNLVKLYPGLTLVQPRRLQGLLIDDPKLCEPLVQMIIAATNAQG